MQPAESAATFQAAVSAAGLTVAELGAADALAQMMAFYHDVRADNCILDEEGDTLLCQWGLVDQGPAPDFQLEFNRHFIEPGDEDEDGMSQLSLTLHYAPTEGVLALGQGVRQCVSPNELEEFGKSLRASPPYRVLSALQPRQTTLDWYLV